MTGLSCGDCKRWRPVLVGNFGFCAWKPENGPLIPCWRVRYPSGDLLTHRTHGAECRAYLSPRQRKPL